MNTDNVTIRSIACLCCVLFFMLTACDKKKSPPPSAKKVVSQKIAVSKPAPAAKPKPAPKPAKKPAIAPKSDIISAAAETEPAEGPTKVKLPVGVSGLILMARGDGETLTYTKGGLDPFEPLFKEETPTPEVPVGELKPLWPPANTPLEMMDLTQFRLVAIIRAPSGNKALVEETAAIGKGYVVKTGDRIGNRCGVILDISKDTLVVEEKERDLYGKVKIEKKELELPKPRTR